MENDRREVAKRRLLRVVGNHGIANMRTLEQKISDAGPGGMRVDPHILTEARQELVTGGCLRMRREEGAHWYHLPGADLETVESRLEEQLPTYRKLARKHRIMRIGQCLEIMVYRALRQQDAVEFLGGFPDLDRHDDSKMYSKREPPDMISGRSIAPKSLDFLLRHPEAGWAGVEIKNKREWLYPDSEEIKELLHKATALDCVPVLIARRVPYVTFRLLKPCGVILHQTYNQRLPEADRELADRARRKDLLGYHDIRTGNAPDQRMLRFIHANLAEILPAARGRFGRYKDILARFGSREILYEEFTARIRRREKSANEDHDWDDGHG